ncbi:hypothetical protein [Streptomyces roseolilacinus]|uniref:Uncharacterized protein n=1 Tax=Streptomyces roseolilacinus TaxID=66904 RepID=A0A918EN04_9ACTN|nr:hypothetical protein [Streptomyces roseolilacinus]GGQ20705.1 hypothetical protein GCM10010249_44210 [Streptomyces roseolilacinus]
MVPRRRWGDQDRALLLDAPEGQRPREYAETARTAVDTFKPLTVFMRVRVDGGALTVGGDPGGSSGAAHALAGAVKSLRLWTGAMNAHYVMQHVLPEPQ